jgi:hypothetical protein
VPRGLHTTATPRGIVDLELAWSRGRADRILDAWGPTGWRSAILLTYLDILIFIPAYAFVLAVAVVCSSVSWDGTGIALLPTGGIVIAWLQWVAGVLDWLEDGFLLHMLRGRERQRRSQSPWAPRLASMCATVKFALIGTGVLYALSFPVVKVLER